MKLNKENIPTALGLKPGHLLRVTGPRGGLRHYEVPGSDKPYPSVTTILSETVRKPALERGRESLIRKGLEPNTESKAAAAMGSNLHSIVEELLRGNEEVSIPPELENAVQGFFAWRRAMPMTHLESEVAVYDGWATFAGTVDAIFRGPEGLVVVDFKSGSKVYPEALLQVRAYIQALQYMGCNEKIRGMIVCMVKDRDVGFDGSVQVVEAKFTGDIWKSVLDLYNFSKSDLPTKLIS